VKLSLKFPVYPDLTIKKGGFLPADNRAYALWYYYTLAQQLHEKLGKGIDDQFGLIDGDRWLDPHYEQIARSIAFVYGFSNPGEFFEDRFWKAVTQQAVHMGYPDPTGKDYTQPLKIVIH